MPPTSSDASSRPFPAWFAGIFALAVFVSAFLLFQVQPLIGRYVLPWFGGSPGVWTTALLFFQVLLFLGYAYSHWVSRLLSPRAQALTHLALLLVAAATLPIIPHESWKPSGPEEPTLRILGLLGTTVGVPYFVLSSTGPLLQSWFARTWPGRSPYRLYSLSNVGSLLALLSYPFLVEPSLELPGQAWLWSGGFLLFVATIAVCALGAARAARAQAPAPQPAASPTAAEAPVFLPQRALWVALPALGSVTLLAGTNHVCQNVAVVPFLWVVPLALYLTSFIFTFDHERWYRRGVWGPLAALLIVLTAGSSELPWVSDFSVVPELGLYFATLFCICMIAHGELARQKPGPRHLTEFYLLMSAGGALGGVLVSLIAPRVFSTFFEWNLTLLLGLVVAVWALSRALADVFSDGGARPARVWMTNRRAATTLGGLWTAGAVAAVFVAIWQHPEADSRHRARNFYGVVSVWDVEEGDPGDHHRSFFSGHINHGRQFLHPEKRHLPTAYYGEASGAGRALKFKMQSGRPLRVGVVGLGVGTLATYSRPGDSYRFYEINPEVTQIAERYFHFLPGCKGRCEVMSGDARLLLEREQDEPYDVLVLDAFSGDAVPVHLLTREAFAIYLSRLKPDGLLAINITNTYLHLSPVVQRLADHFELFATRIATPSDRSRLLFRADYMVLGRNGAFAQATPAQPPAAGEPALDVPLWTDNFSNLFLILKGS